LGLRPKPGAVGLGRLKAQYFFFFLKYGMDPCQPYRLCWGWAHFNLRWQKPTDAGRELIRVLHIIKEQMQELWMITWHKREMLLLLLVCWYGWDAARIAPGVVAGGYDVEVKIAKGKLAVLDLFKVQSLTVEGVANEGDARLLV